MRLTHAALIAMISIAGASACSPAAEEAEAAGTAESAGGAAAAAAADASDAAPAAISPDVASLGDADAPLTVIEYASTTCSHCADFNNTMFPHLRENWIERGQVRWVIRALPTAPAELSVAGFLLARCAGDGEDYFAVLDELFASQPALIQAANGGALQDYYEGIGARNGVTPQELEACFADESGIAQINASIDAAEADMIAGTPSFIIGGVQYGAGELPDAATWDATLQAALDARN